MSDNLETEFFVDGDFSANIEYITLFVRFPKGMVKAIDVQR